MTKHCISCGMPMQKPEEFAASDETKDYCAHCSRPDGSMKSYDEVLDGMAGFMVQTQGLDGEAAKEAAKSMMAGLPAWKEQ